MLVPTNTNSVVDKVICQKRGKRKPLKILPSRIYFNLNEQANIILPPIEPLCEVFLDLGDQLFAH